MKTVMNFHLPILLSSLFASSNHDIGSTSGSLNVSDAERKIMDTYEHEEYIEKEKKKLCQQANKGENCRDQSELKAFGLIPPEILGAVSKAYGTVIGSGALGDEFPLDEGRLSDLPEEEAAEMENQKDYCRFLALGTEGAALVMQGFKQDHIEKSSEGKISSQAESLHKAAAGHEARATSALIQTVGWGATSGCYVAMGAIKPINILDIGYIAKTAGSALLAGFFFDVHNKELAYAEEMKKIADSLPKKGECNPISERYCYCAQDSTKNDPKYCLPEMHQRKKAASSTSIICTDENKKSDPKCKCVASDSCYDKKIMSKIDGFDKIPGVAKSFKQYRSMMRGELPSKNLVSRAMGKAVGSARIKLKKIAAKMPQGHLTPYQKKTASSLASYGIPGKITPLLTSLPDNSTGKNMFHRLGDMNNSHASSHKRRKKIIRFTGGKGINRKEKKAGSKFDFSKFTKKKTKRGISSKKILHFSEKATNLADISNQKETNIFQIISRRYKTSTSRRLQ